MKENIRNFTYKNLELKIVELNLKRFRAEQIFRQIYKNFISDFDELKNIPKSSIEILKNNFYISDLNLLKTSSSEKDNTKKFLFQTTVINKSAENIESVLIREETRETFCISTQAGCNVGCEFCATGKMNLLRNLSSGEIVSQVYDIIKATHIIPTNIVYMGMGEPFLNYSNLIDSLLILTDEKGLNIPARRITVSTVGFKGKIKKFADDIINENSLKNVKLALSLHTTDVGLRESIIPTSNKNKLSDIYEELIYFYRATKNKITYEYIHFPGLNDTDNDVKRLSKLSRMIPCNINIIPFHPIDFVLKKPLDIYNNKIYGKNIEGKEFSLLYSEKLTDFVTKLKGEKVVVNVRSSSGIDINAACGQLALKNIS